MTDIFLSYTEKDREVARRVASTLEAVGWSVWWDRRIPAGETWRSVLEKALENMRCMIVLWSSRSIESEWVYEEASEGRRLDKLVPVMIEAVRPPAGFREIQAADLTGWDGSREFDGMRMLIADLENFLGKPAQAATPRPDETDDEKPPPYDPADLNGGGVTTNWWQQHRLPVMAATGLLLTAGAAYLALSSRQAATLAPRTGEPAVQEPASQPAPAAPAPPLATPAAPAPLPTAPEVATVAPPAEPAPAHATPEATPPVVKLPPKVARTPVKRTEGTRTVGGRCADLLYKIQLGESLSNEDQGLFRKECQQ
jgi:hypothetical protein